MKKIEFMKIFEFILKGNLFAPLTLLVTVFFISVLLFRIDDASSSYYKKRITIPMKNFFVPPPAQPKQKSSAKKKDSSQDDSALNEPDLMNIKRLYLSNMVQMINRAKRYPDYERRSNKEGVVKVKLTIAKDGSIKLLQVLTASRFDGFNKEAKAAILRSAPYGKFPQALPDEEITVIFNVVFRLS